MKVNICCFCDRPRKVLVTLIATAGPSPNPNPNPNWYPKNHNYNDEWLFIEDKSLLEQLLPEQFSDYPHPTRMKQENYNMDANYRQHLCISHRAWQLSKIFMIIHELWERTMLCYYYIFLFPYYIKEVHVYRLQRIKCWDYGKTFVILKWFDERVIEKI